MNKTIQINGLTPQQVKLADLLWKCETELQVAAIIALFGHEARVVRDMIIAATLDTVTETNIAGQVLDRFRL
jgi:hypothetical protein